MKIKTQLKILGMKASKGQLESGQSYDSTKVYVLTDLDESKGNAKGCSTQEYNYGESVNFESFKSLAFPFDADAEIEMVSNGRTTKAVIVSLKPVSHAKQAPQA